ncbi:MAG: proprotein convertase P-domain-containing protein [Kofleriaceae bacterium]
MRHLLLLTLLVPPLMGACGFGDDGGGSSNTDAAIDAAIDAPVDAPPTSRVYEMLLNPALAIPDNNPTGVDISFSVLGLATVSSLDVQVDVTHTYRGDVRIELFRDGSLVETLKVTSSLDSADDVKATYTVSAATLGTPLNGTYAVRFTDVLTSDTGSINLVRLTFHF